MHSKQEFEQQVATAVREFGMRSVLVRNATSRKLGLNITDMECLSLLSLKGISSPTELARYTGLTTGSTTAMLDRLEEAELISRKPNPSDRRGVLIEINHSSTQKIAGMFAGALRLQAELISSYSDKELETIADFLTRFVENLKKHTANIEDGIS
jgi:DNA-binding MarR family transcriptional regulator